jgi:hypothetical protein
MAGVLLAVLAACRSGAPAAHGEPGPFDWMLGTWEGVRRGGGDGDAAPMTMRVESILGGAGVVQHLEVRHGGGVYRGFAVQVLDQELGRPVRQYVNDTTGRFVRLEGEGDGERSTWRSVAPERTRESRLVSERVPPDGWRRTQSVSEDGGLTWRVLWQDELSLTRGGVPSRW